MDAAARRAAVRSALLGAAVLLTAAASYASEIVVTNVSDVVNGDVSSPAALLTDPGPDGISLREAIEAANTTRGFHTIMISPALAGQTIALASTLPFVTRDGVTLTGLTAATGQPSITILGAPSGVDILVVYASDFTLTGFRFLGVGAQGSAVFIRAGAAPRYPAPAQIVNLNINGNVFDAAGVDGSGVTIAPENGSTDALIRNVTIAHNVFLNHGYADGVAVGTAGTNGLVENVIIEGNSFSDNQFPVELGASGSNGRVSGVQILRNTFTGDQQSITVAGTIQLPGFPPASGNVVENVLISGNVIRGGPSAIPLLGGLDATGNAILGVEIKNNLITDVAFTGIALVGGQGNARDNRIEGVRIANNTIVTRGGGGGLRVFANEPGPAVSNLVTDVTVRNSIFWGEQGSGGFLFDVTPELVEYSITPSQGFAGLNGNISADPKFVNPTQGDYHLQPGSPAIDAGTSEDAPSRDLEGRPRFDDPTRPNVGGGPIRYSDMGAYEFSTLPTYRLTVTTAGNGSGTIASDPSGIDCGAECTALYYAGALVTLTPVPASGSVFRGWSGDPSCGSGVVTMASDATCAATFARWRQTRVIPFRP